MVMFPRSSPHGAGKTMSNCVHVGRSGSLVRPVSRATSARHTSKTLSILHRTILFLPLLTTLGTHSSGCAYTAGQSSSASSAPGITITPASAQVFVGSTVQFSATAQNSTASTVIWNVNNIAGGNSTVGTIDIAGNYIAPATVPTPSTVAITAVLQSTPSATGTASATVQPASAIQGPLLVAPGLASVTTSQTQQFIVTSPAISNSVVTWSVNGIANGNSTVGTITPGGLYSPPSTAGIQTIGAAVQANPAANGSAQIAVTNYAGTFTWRNDNTRSGWNLDELALTPSITSTANFGKLFSCTLDGFTYAQPLYIANLAIPGKGTHNVVVAATENDSVFAFDADSSPCVQLWQASLVPSGEEAVSVPNFEITTTEYGPWIGITGTPVVDPTTWTLYVVAKTATVAINPVYIQRIYALDLTTGKTKILPSGSEITLPSNVSPAFSSLWEDQRPSLLLDNETLYVAFGSHDDMGDYHGWVLAYAAATLVQTASFTDTPLGTQGGIEQSGGGPSADANHNVYVATSNGTFDVNRGGENYGNSFLRLNPSSGLAVSA